MSSTNRRVFLLSLAAAGPVLAATPVAKGPATLDEKDPQAVALGYVSNSAKADGKKFPNHRPDQHCSGCQLFQGKAGESHGACPIFAGRQVAATGWCSSWIKKAA